MMVKCPVCKGVHSLPDKYDNKDFICQNGPSRRGRKTFQNLPPETLLTRNNPLMNRRSTKEDTTSPATVTVDGPSYGADGERVGTLTKKNY